MDSNVNGWLFAIVAVTGVVCVIVSLSVAWFCARVVRRVTEQNRDLLKANLALSEKPAALALAQSMEGTDRATIASVAAPVSYGNRRVPAGAS